MAVDVGGTGGVLSLWLRLESRACKGQHGRMLRATLLLAAGLCAGCSSFAYDLSDLPYPVTATPNRSPELHGEPFALSAKDVLWVHGLFGESIPDVAALLREQCGECAGIADLRVGVAGTFHDWLATHLSLGFVRMKTVTIRGTRLTAPTR